MASESPVRISKQSRYRYTKVFKDGDVVEWGIYVPPTQFDSLVGDEVTHTVNENEIGFFDKIMVDTYGSSTEQLWWVVCRLNGIVDPENDVKPGQVLLLPNPARVTQFLGA